MRKSTRNNRRTTNREKQLARTESVDGDAEESPIGERTQNDVRKYLFHEQPATNWPIGRCTGRKTAGLAARRYYPSCTM